MARKKQREFLETDLTSLIDVVFLLLIFFMATSVFKKEELAISLTLPQSESKVSTASDEVKIIEVAVTKNKLALNHKLIELKDLKSTLAKIQNKSISKSIKGLSTKELLIFSTS